MKEETFEVKIMTDMNLQARCIAMGSAYVEGRFRESKLDMNTKALIQNAAACGYAKGYRDKELELKEETKCS